MGKVNVVVFPEGDDFSAAEVATALTVALVRCAVEMGYTRADVLRAVRLACDDEGLPAPAPAPMPRVNSVGGVA